MNASTAGSLSYDHGGETTLPPPPSLHSQARRAGLLYLASGITAPYALLYVPRAIFVEGDPTATADRLRATSWIVELGIAGELLSCSLIGIALLALYRLFRGVSQPLSAAMVVLFLIAVPLQLANLLAQFAALMMASGGSMLAAFSREQLDALAYLFMRLHSRGIEVSQIYWGLWLIPYGLVVRRSGFIPAWLGIPLIIAGVAYVANSMIAMFFAEFSGSVSPIMVVLAAGEIPIVVWLIGWGARREWPAKSAPQRNPETN